MSPTVIVTGSSGGIGSAICTELVAHGWDVVGFDRSPAPSGLAGRITEVDVDLADGPGVAAAVHSVVASGTLDGLVNNAAIEVDVSLADTSDELWDRVMAVNVRAAFICLREAHDALVAARGAVVNISSVHAVATSTNIGAYAASKGALVALTRAAALELGGHGVRVNAVLPGAVDTPMLRGGLGRRPHPDGPDGNLAELVARTPLGAIGRPTEIAGLVRFLLADPGAASITGQAIIADGGATARLGTE